MVAGEHLVGALTRLHDLHVARDFLAQQIERDAVVADHRLAHRGDGGLERWQQVRGRDLQLVVVGLEAVGTTPEQLLEVMKTDLAKYAKLAREAQIKPE